MKSLRVLIPLALILIVLVSSSYFTVKEGEQAIITQFGKPVGGPFQEAGLYFKIPFIQDVHVFEKRLLKWDGSPNQIPTRDKKYIWVDTTARWRITDPLRFLQTVSTERGALSRLDDIIDSVVRDLVSSNLLVELVRSADWDPNRGREAMEEFNPPPPSEVQAPIKKESSEPIEVKQGRQLITRRMLSAAAAVTPQYGIELVDVEIKRINYVESVQKRVFERMISERQRIAAQYRSEGEGEKQSILGTMQKELARIRSEAYEKAQKTRGQADAKATDIYGKAYGQDADFYALFKTLETLSNSPGQDKAELILSTDGEYFKYLKKAK
ncbi:membrane protein [Desulfocarbo indianensis]|nr:membrane protein [Desulfocarbo indianensis]